MNERDIECLEAIDEVAKLLLRETRADYVDFLRAKARRLEEEGTTASTFKAKVLRAMAQQIQERTP